MRLYKERTLNRFRSGDDKRQSDIDFSRPSSQIPLISSLAPRARRFPALGPIRQPPGAAPAHLRGRATVRSSPAGKLSVLWLLFSWRGTHSTLHGGGNNADIIVVDLPLFSIFPLGIRYSYPRSSATASIPAKQLSRSYLRLEHVA
jgi:hypothetical protein